MQEEREDDRHLVAMPLAGKQGVYGVLCLELPRGRFGEADVRFLADLANAAGIAFEKARLHEQANALISELRVINEITQRLNSSLQLEETLRFTTTELLRLFDAEYCCVLQKDPHTDQFVVITANVAELIGESLSPESGFCGVLWQSRESVILSDYRSATPVHSRLMEMTGSRSLLASPLLLNGEMIGAVLLTHRKPHHFSYENYKLLNVLSAHLALALSNARLHEEVRWLSITDNLTGLYNRRYLDEIVQRRQQKDPGGSLVLIDIDHFKQINDTFGHQAGDAVLVQVCKIVASSIRESDIAARWGGEELAVYFPKLDLHLTAGVAERIRKRVEEETRPAVTISCGVAEWKSTDGKVSVESLFAKADAALYVAKKNGRNRVAVG
jgi:diguanylate cyclase (GGDEF)-like protein